MLNSIPRSADGMEIEAGELQRQIEVLEAEIGAWLGRRPDVSKQLLRYSARPVSGSTTGIGNPFGDLSYRINMWNVRRQMDPQTRAQAASLIVLLKRRRSLNRQRVSLAQARRLMALWHADRAGAVCCCLHSHRGGDLLCDLAALTQVKFVN